MDAFYGSSGFEDNDQTKNGEKNNSRSGAFGDRILCWTFAAWEYIQITTQGIYIDCGMNTIRRVLDRLFSFDLSLSTIKTIVKVRSIYS